MSDLMNVYLHFKRVADDLSELHHEILEHLVGAGTARGWFPSLDQVIGRFSEHEPEAEVRAVVESLQSAHLLEQEDGKITRLVSGITHKKTAFRAMTADMVPFHLISALDCLTIARTLQKSVDVQTTCGQSGAPITFSLDKEGNLHAESPTSLTAYVPAWDGSEPLSKALSNSHFFADDAQLQAWLGANGDPEGMPFTQDTLRMVGLELADALADLYVRMSIR